VPFLQFCTNSLKDVARSDKEPEKGTEGKGKGRTDLMSAMQRKTAESGAITPGFVNLSARWRLVISFPRQPLHAMRKNLQYTMEKAVWA
jgi:hypothetical protein